MPGKAAKVTITERQQSLLHELSRSRTEAPMISQRASIILLSFAGVRNEEISKEVGLERKQVGLWRRRWRDSWEALTRLECLEPRRLREAVRRHFEMLRGPGPRELLRPNRSHRFWQSRASPPRSPAGQSRIGRRESCGMK